jgi:TonB-linked SusC/RagA family outer membrane protein
MEMNRNWGYDINGSRNFAPNTPVNNRYFVLSPDNESTTQLIKGGGYEGRAFAYLGRLNYDYKGKYLFTANARYSGRSSFGPENRWGFFPSFSLGWKFSEEEFIKQLGFLSFGKLRVGYGEVGTYGKTGNPYLSKVGYYEVFSYAVNGTTGAVGAAPVQIPNPGLHWETIHMTNVGVDLAFLKNRLSLTLEYYDKVNEDMIMVKQVPYVVGTYSIDEIGTYVGNESPNPEVNIGSVRNAGFEITAGWKDQAGDFKYSIDGNVAFLKNEILDMANDSIIDGGVHDVADICLTRIGGSISQFWGYQTDGLYQMEDVLTDGNGDPVLDSRDRYTIIDPRNGDTLRPQDAQPGDYRWVDQNDDGVYDKADRVDLGCPLPKLTFGLSIKLEYKGIDLSAQFTGVWGNKIFNGSKQYLYTYMNISNRAAAFADRYIIRDVYKPDPITGQDVLVLEANHDTEVARNDARNYLENSDFYVEDGSYLRLRNLQLGYTLPASLTNLVKIERLRIYVGGRNLKTWTKYQGLNPEIGGGNITALGIDAAIYPVARMYLVGLNVTF